MLSGMLVVINELSFGKIFMTITVVGATLSIRQGVYIYIKINKLLWQNKAKLKQN